MHRSLSDSGSRSSESHVSLNPQCPTPEFEVENNGFVLVHLSKSLPKLTDKITMAETHTFPKELPDWSNLEVLHRNTLPPRANFFLFDNEQDALTRDVSKAKSHSLSGTWKFNLAKSPFDAPTDFFEEKFDAEKWGDIQVPGMWQLQGYGKGPHYTNMIYPFPIDPPHVPYDSNETGSYLRTFTVPKEFKNDQLRLRFEGVDSSFHIWVNGKEVGYSQGSRNPSEFDITSFVNLDGENTLAVQVYQFCDGSYIEDQDQWWLSGIFREVNLLAFPKVHFNDFFVQTHLDSEYKDATLSVKVDLNIKSDVHLKLLDASGKVIATGSQSADPTTTFSIPISNPNKWTAESPYLYHLVLSTPDCSIQQRVGFRNSELKNGVFLVNGQPVKFRGVNRHEHHPDHGRAVPYEFLKKDLLLMKTHNINAIRTSHQINDPRLYDLADELGLWVMDECDLECHGFGEVDEISIPIQYHHLPDFEKVAHRPADRNPARWASDNPAWEAAYIDRAHQAVYRDKNHTCVIMWSLGNESFYGRNHQAMYDFITAYDPTRLIHYEGDYEAQTVDIYSRMYSSVDYISEFATKDGEKWEKPLVLCEFEHAMGNGPGNFKEYIDAFYKFPRLMGGFVWEWANHGLRTKNAEGVEYYGYGGDFGDFPNDGHFVMDGLLFSDHTPNPGLIEYRKAIEPVQVLSNKFRDNKVEIINRYDFVTLDHLKCEWSIVSDGSTTEPKELEIPKGIKPHTEAYLTLPSLPSTPENAESYLHLSFTLRSATNWAPAGHEVAFGQILLTPLPTFALIKSLSSPTAPTYTLSSPHILSISGPSSITWKFNIVHGILSSWTSASGSELLASPPLLTFYRAQTDNDFPQNYGKAWTASYLHETVNHVRSVTWSATPDGVKIVVQARVAPPVLEWSVETTFTYLFTNKHVSIHVKGTPNGLNVPRTWARVGLEFGLNNVESASWFGRGPGESYVDKKLAQKFGNYTSSVEKLWTPYEFPQESGNRTDVRWVEFEGKDSKKALKASFADQEGASFTASHFKVGDIDAAKHPYELEKNKTEETIVRLDWAHHGLGSGSCGPPTLPQYELNNGPFEYEVLLE